MPRVLAQNAICGRAPLGPAGELKRKKIRLLRPCTRC